MDNRTETFLQKFSDARNYLGCGAIQDIVSLKYRSEVGIGNSDYRMFIGDVLHNELGLVTQQLQGNFQGTAWLVTDKNRTSVILVEHETGLEILYVAGSIASLVSLIPLVNSGWRYLRGRFLERPFMRGRNSGIEIRTIDSENKLIEQHAVSVEEYILAENLKEIVTLKARVSLLERELAKINEKKIAAKKPRTIPKKRKK
jgi:hypothetical protein